VSNRTLIELNHDYCPRDQELLDWAKKMQLYMRSADKRLLPKGVTFKAMCHHSVRGNEQERAAHQLDVLDDWAGAQEKGKP
jgi:hypothetical protein